MPEQKQLVVEPLLPSGKRLGSRKEANLRSSFSASPIYNEMSDAERFEQFLKLVTTGDVFNGNGVNQHNRDFKGTDDIPVTDLSSVKVGGGGLPSTPYTPNVTSPGPGSINAADQPVFNGEMKDVNSINNFGSGLGGLLSPSETAAKIADSRQKLGQYISGKSFQGSDGKS